MKWFIRRSSESQEDESQVPLRDYNRAVWTLLIEALDKPSQSYISSYHISLSRETNSSGNG